MSTAVLTNEYCFTIPPADRVYFTTALPVEVQEETQLRLQWMQKIAAADRVNTACKKISAGLKRFSRGCSWQRIRALWYQFTRGTHRFKPGDWRILVNWSKVGLTRSELRAEFIEFWRTLCETHQRVTSNAWRELRDLWHARQPFTIAGRRYKIIPGYTDWPDPDPATGLPHGWTETNLYHYTPDRYELAAARIGIQRASQLGLKIRTTRAGLRLGEHIAFDDHEFNIKVNFPGQLQSWRPRCFGAVDDLSDSMPLLAIKPTFWDAGEQKKKVLNETDAMWFIITWLTTRGYREDIGSTFYVEHGLMAVRDWFEQNITTVTGGKVRIARGGRFHTPAHRGQFAPPSGGNFRFKRLVEQYWRMLDDRLDALPAQQGLNRDHAPEENERADNYNNQLLRAAQNLPVEQAAKLILPRLSWTDFVQAAHQAIAAINHDPDHKCAAWEKCGFTTREYRRDLNQIEWQPHALLANEPADIQALVAQSDQHYRLRRMTRAEAWDKHAHELTPLPAHTIPALVGQRHALRGGDPLTVRNGEIEFNDWRIDFDPIRFRAVDQQGHPLPEGEKYIAFCNPMNPDTLILCDDRLRVISTCPIIIAPAHNDQEGIKKMMGQKNQWQAQKLARQRARHAATGSDIEFMRRHNAAVLAGAPTTDDEKRRARNLRKFDGDPATLAEPEATTTTVAAIADADAADATEDFNPEALL